MVSLTYDAENSVYDFETSELKGSLRAQSPDPQVDIRHGISQLVHKPSGVSIIHPKYSALNLFRLFATHTGLGEPRLFERTVRVEGDTLIVNWGPADEHFASIEARYQVKEPNLIDLTITVCAEATYESYEIFLSNYFDPPLLAHVYLATDRYTREPGDGGTCRAPGESDISRGWGWCIRGMRMRRGAAWTAAGNARRWDIRPPSFARSANMPCRWRFRPIWKSGWPRC